MGFFTKLKAVTAEEKQYVETITSRFSDDERDMFLARYSLRRKNLFTFLVLMLPNLIFIGGLQRFYAGDKFGSMKNNVLGVLYFLTGGFCGIGTLFDLFTCKRVIAERNLEIADEVRQQVIEKYHSLLETDKIRKELQSKINSITNKPGGDITKQ